MEDFGFYKSIRMSEEKVKGVIDGLQGVYDEMPGTCGCVENINGDHGCHNWCCIASGVKVFSEDGMVPIEKLNKGDKVFSGTGSFKTILKKKSRLIESSVVEIHTENGNSIKLTKDHLILLLKGKDIVWVPAEKINLKDEKVFVLFPSNIDYDNDKLFDFDDIYYKMEIVKVELEQYSGYVHDIEIEDDVSFITECGEVHNCKIQTPQFLYSEFLFALINFLDKASNDDFLFLLEKCMLNAVDDIPSKGCVFFDRDTDRCSIYNQRPYACRIYGVIPKEEFDIRYHKIRKDYESIPGAILKYQCDKVKTEDGKDISTFMTNYWWKKLSEIEISIGIPENLVSDKMGGSYRSPHDHILLYFMPENVLNALAGIRLYKDFADRKIAVAKIISNIKNLFKESV